MAGDMKVLVTGGMGFIGSAVVRHLIGDQGVAVVNVDALTYAANPDALEAAGKSPLHAFVHADIRDGARMRAVLAEHRPDAVLHLAAETHVDRSIDGPAAFIDTNVSGTCVLLEAAAAYWGGLDGARRERFRFHLVSTDEVFGDLSPTDPAFTEDSPYRPNSPYAASKAAADHLARAWRHTFGLPVVITNCSNNYGPWQFPEKLIPLVTLRAAAGQPLPIYGTGDNVRDWLHVEDHARALFLVLTQARPGASYNVGGGAERRNIDLVRGICAILDDLRPQGAPHDRLIAFVADRPGHDRRYAIDSARLRRDLDWAPAMSFDAGLRRTVEWYLDNGHRWDEEARRRRGLATGGAP